VISSNLVDSNFNAARNDLIWPRVADSAAPCARSAFGSASVIREKASQARDNLPRDLIDIILEAVERRIEHELVEPGATQFPQPLDDFLA